MKKRADGNESGSGLKKRADPSSVLGSKSNSNRPGEVGALSWPSCRASPVSSSSPIKEKDVRNVEYGVVVIHGVASCEPPNTRFAENSQRRAFSG